MLEKPQLDENALAMRLEHTYGIGIARLEFLPLGADPDAAVYQAASQPGVNYFVKLKRGAFDEVAPVLLDYLGQNGLAHVIAPIRTNRGDLWTGFDPFTVVLYPFVIGQDGYAAPLTEENWLEFGRTLKHLHTLELTDKLEGQIQQETFDPRWRNQVRDILEQLETLTFDDAISVEMAGFIRGQRTQILDLVANAERLAQALQGRTLEPVLCHADLHAGNLLIMGRQDFYIVDWDAPVFAPKERDLMFIGGGLGFRGYTPQEEEALFYEGYGQTDLDLHALAYYRLERIVQDIAVYSDELVRQLGSDDDRAASLGYLRSNFKPGGTIERAYAVNP